jgi:hypothetical protein
LKRAARKEVVLGRATNGTHGTHETHGLAVARFTSALLLPDACHALADAALINKIALQAPDLLIEKIVGLVDETDGNIRHDLARARLAEVAKIVEARLRLRREPPNK